MEREQNRTEQKYLTSKSSKIKINHIYASLGFRK